MQRCAESAASAGASRRSFVFLLGSAGLLAALSALPARAQALMRRFPRNALRGEIAFGAYPEIALNGQLARLAPSARVRDATNIQPIFGSLVGNKFIVNYTADTMGLVQDVWILRPDEIAGQQPWPRTLQEMQSWGFDEQGQRWIKP